MTAPAPAAPGAAPCPRCRAAAAVDAQRCPACGLLLHGQLARELWLVDQQVQHLHRRRAALLEQGDAPHEPAAGSAPTGGPAGAAPAAAADRDPTPSRRLSAQRLLLTTGVALVAVAALGFGAVVFARVGVAGQAAVLLALCAASALAAQQCLRRGLHASAEALAVLAVAVAVVVLAAAHARGLLGVDAVEDDTWTALALALLSAACTSAVVLLRGAPPLAYGWAALGTAALLPSAAALALDGRAPTWAASALLLAGACAALAPAARRHSRALEEGALVLGAVHLGAALLVLVGVVAVHATDADVRVAALQLALLAAAAAATARGAARRRPRLAGLARHVARGAGGGALVALAVLGGPVALLVLAGAAATATAAAVLVRLPVPWPALVLAPAVAAAALLVEPLEAERQGAAGGWARPAVWAALALATALAGARRPSPRPGRGGHGWASVPAGWAAASAAAAVAAALLVPDLDGPDPALLRTAALLAVSGAALGLAAARRHRDREAVLVGAWALGAVLALAVVPDGPALLGPQLVLAVAGAEALCYGLLPGRLGFRVAGVVLASAAWWVLVDDLARAPQAVELRTVPPAALALVVGALSWRRRPAATSWAVLGPGLVAGIAPSALLSLEPEQGGVLRAVLTVVLAVALCAVGYLRSWQAPLVVGALAALLVALGQLGPYAVQAPLWASLGLTGAVVLVLAVRLEQARRDAARAATWVRALR